MPAPEFIKNFRPEKDQPLAEQVKEGLEVEDQKTQVLVEAQAERGAEELELQRTLDQLERIKERIAQLREEVGEIESSMWRRILDGRDKESLLAGIERLSEKEEGLESQAQELQAADEKRQATMEEVEAALNEMPRAGSIITDFYAKKREEWAQAEFDAEEVDKYFNAEFLASLDIDAYVDLLKRFPQQMVTHVSRNGVRDHVGMAEHAAGIGEMRNEFKGLLKARAMNSAIGRMLVQEGAEEKIYDQLELGSKRSRAEAVGALEDFLAQRGWAKFGDFSSVHFAVEEVADYYYGAERGNEAFVAYPSLFIASQFEFGGHYGDLSRPNTGDTQRNDVWVWQQELNGIDLDAGIVFLPKRTMVSAETGSKYEVKEGKAVEDDHMLERLDALVGHPSFVNEAEELEQRLHAHWRSRELKDDEEIFMKEQADILLSRSSSEDAALLPGLMRAVSQYKISDYLRLNTLLSEGAQDSQHANHWEYKMLCQNILLDDGLLYKKAENPVEAEAYWEHYFDEHPDERPSKVVYYEGNDPTAALRKWREEHGLVKKESRAFYDALETDHGEGAVLLRYRELAMQLIEQEIPPDL